MKGLNRVKNKLIVVALAMVLFSVLFPRNVKAIGIPESWEIQNGALEIVYRMEHGLLQFLNNLFVDEGKEAKKDGDTIYLSPETIIKGKFVLMDADVFKDYSSATGYYDYDETAAGQNSGVRILQATINGWYKSLRNFAAVALLSVLVYIGIRMMISTVAQDKAKYKNMLKDWLVAMCLVALMDFVMIATLTLADTVTSAFGTEGANSSILSQTLTEIEEGLKQANEGEDEEAGDDGRQKAMGEEIVLAAIILFTIMFAVKYIIRKFTIVFLVLLAPITAITYPIDKVKDNQAQAYNVWFREFFYNVMIQPFHLLIYIVLIGSANAIADTNPIYAILCFAMMTPAEKLIRTMFGFQNRMGPSPLGAMATGAGLSKLLQGARSLRPEGGHGGNNSEGGNSGRIGGGHNDNADQTGLPPAERGDITAYDDGDGSTANTGDIAIGAGAAGMGGQASGEGADQSNPVTRREEQPIYGNDGQEIGREYTEENALADASAAGIVTAAEQGLDNRENASLSSSGTQANDGKVGKVRQAVQRFTGSQSARRVKAEHDRRLREKYGTADKKKVWKKRAGKGVRHLARAAEFGGRVVGAGALGTAAAFARFTTTGDLSQSFEAGVAGFAGGAALGGKAVRTITGATGRVAGAAGTAIETVKDYRDVARGKDLAREKEKKDFMNNQSQIDRATQRLRERNGGNIPSKDELNEEMERRYNVYEMGIRNNDVIDRTLDLQDDRFEELKQEAENRGETVDEDAIREKANDQAYYAASIADEYRSASDYRDEKKMAGLYNDKVGELKSAGVSDAQAHRMATNAISDAAALHGVQNVAIPSRQATTPASVSNSNVSTNNQGNQPRVNQQALRQSASRTSEHREHGSRTNRTTSSGSTRRTSTSSSTGDQTGTTRRRRGRPSSASQATTETSNHPEE